MNMNKKISLLNEKILVTGGNGFLGKYVIKQLLDKGANKKNIYTFSSKEHDLRKPTACHQVVTNMDIIIHLAANVGGIGYNQANPGSLFFDNLTMGVHLMEAARQANVKKFVAIGTICAYPKYTKVPFKEKDLWNGYPEETNAPYGLAKKMLLVQAQAYRKQYNFNAIYLLPVNLYGPGDNFNPESSHVIPALIKKVYDAKINHDPSITVWGDGSASREFLYVEDCAKAIILATQKYDKENPINLGASFEITIKELIEKIVKLMDYQGKIIWDKTKPNGQPRRKLNTSKAQKEFGFKATTTFNIGLKKTIDWYINEKK